MVEVPPLPTMLSQALVAFTIEFDNEFEKRMPHRTSRHGASEAGGPWLMSLAMWANCMRFLPPEGLTVGELRVLARADTNTDGMRRWGYVTIDSASVLRPTAAGVQAQEVWRPLAGVVERRWRERFGAAEVERLRESLPVTAPGRGRQVRLTRNGVAAQRLYRKLLGIIEDRWDVRFGPDVLGSLRDALGALVGPLFAGLPPYPDGWRAAIGAPALLPHYPMVLHRGGFPDGS
jgi:hypothetical protein